MKIGAPPATREAARICLMALAAVAVLGWVGPQENIAWLTQERCRQVIAHWQKVTPQDRLQGDPDRERLFRSGQLSCIDDGPQGELVVHEAFLRPNDQLTYRVLNAHALGFIDAYFDARSPALIRSFSLASALGSSAFSALDKVRIRHVSQDVKPPAGAVIAVLKRDGDLVFMVAPQKLDAPLHLPWREVVRRDDDGRYVIQKGLWYSVQTGESAASTR